MKKKQGAEVLSMMEVGKIPRIQLYRVLVLRKSLYLGRTIYSKSWVNKVDLQNCHLD